MNRRKKGNNILKARAKKANAKLSPNNKPKYISKADRIITTAIPDGKACVTKGPIEKA